MSGYKPQKLNIIFMTNMECVAGRGRCSQGRKVCCDDCCICNLPRAPLDYFFPTLHNGLFFSLTLSNATIAAMEACGHQEGFTFNMKKTEMIHFAYCGGRACCLCDARTGPFSPSPQCDDLAAWAVAMPNFFYGADIWYSGSGRVLKGHLVIIQKTLTAACPMILPS